MTKSQPCASFLRPARLCRFLLLLGAFKLCLTGTLLLDPAMDMLFSSGGFLSQSNGGESTAEKDPASASALQTGAETMAAAFGLASAQAAPAAPAPTDAQAASDAPTTASPATPEQSPGLAREALARKEQELARREQDLQTLERELDDRLERLQVLEARLSQMLKDANEVKEEKFRRLVDMLSNMKAKQAASVLETIDEATAVKILAGMRGRQSGEILTYVNPTKAARLAEALARMQLPFEG